MQMTLFNKLRKHKKLVIIIIAIIFIVLIILGASMGPDKSWQAPDSSGQSTKIR
jgi:uncharacterized protein YpmB